MAIELRGGRRLWDRVIRRSLFTNCTRRVQQQALSGQVLFRLHLDVDVNTCGHLQSLESIHRLLGGSDDVDQTLVSALLELLTRIFIFMNGSEDSNNLFAGGKRNGAAHLGAVLLNCLDDLLRGSIHELVIIRLQSDPHYLICHKKIVPFLFALLGKYDKR